MIKLNSLIPIKLNKPQTLILTSLLLTLIFTILCGFALRYYGSTNFDEALLLWFRVSGDTDQLAGPHWMNSFWSAVSWVGDKTPRITVAIITVLGLLALRRWHNALFITGVLLSGVALTALLKHWIARPRPDLVSHLDHISLRSFPSGHTLNSTLFYLTVAWVIIPLLPWRIARRSLLTSAIILSLAIGVSRIALGVHWPSDVLASWIIATTWLSLWIMLARYYWPENKL